VFKKSFNFLPLGYQVLQDILTRGIGAMRKLSVIMIFMSASVLTFGQNHVNQDSLISEIRFGSKATPLKGLTITWKSPGKTDSIQWGYTDNFEKGKFAAYQKTEKNPYFFNYTFPDLLPDTVIFYSVFNSLSKQWTHKYKFRTSVSDKSTHFTFTVLGDSRTRLDAWHMLSSSVRRANFSIFVGDIVSRGGSIKKWDNWFKYGEKYLSQNLVYHTPGNHEYYGDPENSNYKNMFVYPENSNNNNFYYYFKFGNAVFICLNSEDAGDTTQFNWLIKTLEINESAKWKFVWLHKPFYTSPSHAREMDKYYDTWWKAFDMYGVDVIFAGHTHNYQRTIPINREICTTEGVESYGSLPYQGRCQIVTGGAGAPLAGKGTGWFIASSRNCLNYVFVEVIEDTLKIRAFNEKNILIDKLTIVK